MLSWHRSPRICVFVFVFLRLRSWKYASSFLKICVFVFFLRFFAFSFFCVLLRFRFFFAFSFFLRLFFLRSRVNGCRSRCISFSSLSHNMTLFFIKNQNNMLYTYFQRQSKYFLYIKELFLICRLLYNAPIEMRSFASSFLCVFVFLRLRFFCVFFLRFRFFLRLRSLKYASSFSEICVFVLWNMRLRSSAKTKTMST